MVSLYLSPTGSMLVSASSRGLLRLWDTRGQGGRPRAAAPAVTIITGQGPATAMALNAAGMQVGGASGGGGPSRGRAQPPPWRSTQRECRWGVR